MPTGRSRLQLPRVSKVPRLLQSDRTNKRYVVVLSPYKHQILIFNDKKNNKI